MRSILPPDGHRQMKPDASLAIVNVVLLLIFFFLATGQLMNSPSYGAVLSETSKLPIDVLPQPILIIDPDGGFSLNGTPLDADLLGTALAGQTLVHVLIDKTAPATDLLQLLARPELAEMEVRLVTLHKRGEVP